MIGGFSSARNDQTRRARILFPALTVSKAIILVPRGYALDAQRSLLLLAIGPAAETDKSNRGRHACMHTGNAEAVPKPWFGARCPSNAPGTRAEV